ncbi:hypothetical protein T05_9147 [Trichinella murrelli]|uniref:Uncharacterized protein n=1 Tax=Trichinella murrelli TaxID=144512 RepID=A0A0V0U768_9BILA|nr:hypothetical protein T05_9147 [Trichinella murrelli]
MQNLPHSVGQTKRTISPPLGAGKSTKLPAHLRQVKQLSLTRLFSAESLGFPRSREEERALCLPKEQGRVCTLPCLREGSFTLQDGAHFWSLHPPPALNISSPISGITFHARLRQIVSSPTCRHLPQLTNKRFDPTYPPSVHSLMACSTFVLSSPCYPKPRLTELGPTGNHRYLLSFLGLFRVVRDPFRVVRDLHFVSPAIDVRRINNGVFNAMTDEE